VTYTADRSVPKASRMPGAARSGAFRRVEAIVFFPLEHRRPSHDEIGREMKLHASVADESQPSARHGRGADMKIAMIGTGIAGNLAFYLLAAEHELAVFEQNDHVAGHTNTVRVDAAEDVHNVDTGFVVFNEERYPSFARLLEKLGVESQPSSPVRPPERLRDGSSSCT
jgi:hypothetical protein